MSKLRDELLETASPKISEGMLILGKLKDAEDPEDKVYQHLLNNCTKEELAAVACNTVAEALLEVIQKTPSLSQILSLMRDVDEKLEE